MAIVANVFWHRSEAVTRTSPQSFVVEWLVEYRAGQYSANTVTHVYLCKCLEAIEDCGGIETFRIDFGIMLTEFNIGRIILTFLVGNYPEAGGRTVGPVNGYRCG
jgi:hypothetical protein